MAHFSRLSQIVIDAPADQHATEVGFWAGALGVPVEQQVKFPEFHGAELDAHFGLLVQRLGDGPPRMHVDIHTTDRTAEVARLVALGASVVDETGPWTIMRDPAGLIFCVGPDRGLNAENAHEWTD
jgi:hypothetical protein